MSASQKPATRWSLAAGEARWPPHENKNCMGIWSSWGRLHHSFPI